jgi:hypothetical protein
MSRLVAMIDLRGDGGPGTTLDGLCADLSTRRLAGS